MSKEIKITLEWGRDQALRASKIFYDYDMRYSNKRYMGWFFIALTQFAIVGALKHDTYGLLFIATFLVGYWYYGRWYIRNAIIKKHFKNIKEETLEFILKSDGLYIDNKSIPFEEIFKVIKIEEDILVHISDSTLLFPRKSFHSYSDLQLFLTIMKKQGKV